MNTPVSERGLDRLGAAIRAAQQSQKSDALVARVAARLARPAPQSRQRWFVAALAAVASALLVLFFAHRSPLETEPARSSVAGPGTWRSAAGEVLPLRFADDSRITLAPRTAARIETITPRAATVTLKQGSLEVEIIPGQARRWVFAAGPYRVHVLGTVFQLQWQPEQQRLRVAMRRGKVRVEGPGAQGRSLVAGESLQLTATPAPTTPPSNPSIEPPPPSALNADATAAPGPSTAATPPTAAAATTTAIATPEPPTVTSAATATTPAVTPSTAATATTAVASPEPPTVAARTPAPATAATPVVSPSRRGQLQHRVLDPIIKLAREGHYERALRELQSQAHAGLLDAATAAELLVLANAARLANQQDLALRFYRMVRKRFGGSHEAALAAFGLARLAFDQRGDYRGAERWLRRYLTEQPMGQLARECLGRIIEARRLRNDLSGARSAAQHYLVLYPRGPHATLARRLLASSGKHR